MVRVCSIQQIINEFFHGWVLCYTQHGSPGSEYMASRMVHATVIQGWLGSPSIPIQQVHLWVILSCSLWDLMNSCQFYSTGPLPSRFMHFPSNQSFCIQNLIATSFLCTALGRCILLYFFQSGEQLPWLKIFTKHPSPGLYILQSLTV